MQNWPNTRINIYTVFLYMYNILNIWFINSSPPSAAYMRQCIGSVMAQIMTCRLFGAKPLSEPMLCYVIWTLGKKLQWNSNQDTIFFIRTKEYEYIVYKIASILSRVRWVNGVIFHKPNRIICNLAGVEVRAVVRRHEDDNHHPLYCFCPFVMLKIII